MTTTATRPPESRHVTRTSPRAERAEAVIDRLLTREVGAVRANVRRLARTHGAEAAVDELLGPFIDCGLVDAATLTLSALCVQEMLA